MNISNLVAQSESYSCFVEAQGKQHRPAFIYRVLSLQQQHLLPNILMLIIKNTYFRQKCLFMHIKGCYKEFCCCNAILRMIDCMCNLSKDVLLLHIATQFTFLLKMFGSSQGFFQQFYFLFQNHNFCLLKKNKTKYFHYY